MKKRWICLGLGLLLALIPACSGEKTPDASAQPAQTDTAGDETGPQETIDITLALWDTQAQPEDSASTTQVILQKIRDDFGLNITPFTLSRETGMDELRQAAAAGTLPDFFSFDLMANKLDLMMWIDQGAIRDIPAAAYADLPDLSRVMGYSSGVLAQPDGRIYTIPRTNAAFELERGSGLGIYYRTDWASSLGYTVAEETPWADFISLMYDYTRKDPNKNNIVDTRGITLAGGDEDMLLSLFMTFFGVRDWVLEDGQWTPGLITDRAKEAITWINQLYRDGIIDPDYSKNTAADAYAKFASGQTGMLIADGTRAGARTLRVDYWGTYNPNTSIENFVAILPLPANAYGVRYAPSDICDTGTLVSAGVSDEKLKRTLALFDWLYTQQGLTYMTYGEQGRDYTVQDGVARSLMTNGAGEVRTFGALNDQMPMLRSLSTWNEDGLAALEGANDFDAACQQRMETLWWPYRWHSLLFTQYLLEPEIAAFDLSPVLEAWLPELMMTDNLEDRWADYVAACMWEMGTQQAVEAVNRYARLHGILKEE